MIKWSKIRKEIDLFCILTSPSLHIMQYTGFKDIDGKEIYSCDILEKDNTIVIVSWDRKNGRFIGKLHDVILYPPDWSKTRIVGNVYENKELIEGV